MTSAPPQDIKMYFRARRIRIGFRCEWALSRQQRAALKFTGIISTSSKNDEQKKFIKFSNQHYQTKFVTSLFLSHFALIFCFVFWSERFNLPRLRRFNRLTIQEPSRSRYL